MGGLVWLLSPGRPAVCAVTSPVLVLAAATPGKDGGQSLSSTGRWAGAPSAPRGGWDRPPASESPGHYREEGPCVQHTSTQAFSSRDALLQDCAYVRAGFKTCSSERERADHAYQPTELPCSDL